MKPALGKVLLTGFEPFAGEAENPSWQAVHALAGARIASHRIETRRLPVVFGEALECLRQALDETEPALVICVGQAGGRAQICLERIAINVDDARIPDNAGHRPIDARIVADGPAGYFSTLPIKRALLELQRSGVPAEISQTAGTYVCNHVFYGLMHALARRHPPVRGGFVHVPYSSKQARQHADAPGLPLATMTKALRIIIKACLVESPDIKLAAGATH